MRRQVMPEEWNAIEEGDEGGGGSEANQQGYHEDGNAALMAYMEHDDDFGPFHLPWGNHNMTEDEEDGPQGMQEAAVQRNPAPYGAFLEQNFHRIVCGVLHLMPRDMARLLVGRGALESAWPQDGRKGRQIIRMLTAFSGSTVLQARLTEALGPYLASLVRAEVVVRWMVEEVAKLQRRLLVECVAAWGDRATTEAAEHVAAMVEGNDPETRAAALQALLAFPGELLERSGVARKVETACSGLPSELAILAAAVVDKAGRPLPADMAPSAEVSGADVDAVLNRASAASGNVARAMRRLGMARLCASSLAKGLTHSDPSVCLEAVRGLAECGESAVEHADLVARQLSCDNAATGGRLSEEAVHLLARLDASLLEGYARIVVRALLRSPRAEVRLHLARVAAGMTPAALWPYANELASRAEDELELLDVRHALSQCLSRMR